MSPKLKRTFRAGEVQTLELKVTNRAKDRQPIHFEVEDVPEGWRVLLDQESLVLDAKDDGTLRVSIKAPDPPQEKDKVGMTIWTVPEFDPDKRTEIEIRAKLKPTKEQRPSDGGGLFGGSDDEDEEAETGSGQQTSVIRTRPPGGGPPEPDEVVEFVYAPAITEGGIFHVSHIPIGNGTVLKFREQVQLLCRLCSARDVCFEGKFNRYMDRETFLESDHCLLVEGDFD